MTPSLKSAWTTALRSGKYRQGRRQLRSPEGYCAMGVLFDLIASPWEKTLPWGSFLPAHLLERAEISASLQTDIARLNDAGASFEAIADLIDRDADMEEEIGLAVQRELSRFMAQCSVATVETPPQPTTELVQLVEAPKFDWAQTLVGFGKTSPVAKLAHSFGLWA